MTPSRYLGEFEYTVLLALLRHEGPASGVEIHDEITVTTGRDASVPAVYVTLDRMAEKGYVRSRPATRERESRRGRKLFRLTPAGTRAVLRSRELFDRLWDGLELGQER